MKNSDKLKNLLLYANIGHEKYNKTFPHIEKEICLDNKKYLRTYTAITALLMTAVLTVSFIDTKLSVYRPLYCAGIVISAAAFIISNILKPKRMKQIRLLMYGFVFAIYLFGIMLGTFFSPDELASAFQVILIIAPLVFIDRPVFSIALIGISDILFIISALIAKSPECLSSDIINTVIFSIFGALACIYTMNARVQKYFLKHELEIISHTDGLTGIGNRRAFEKYLFSYPENMPKNTCFIYIDVNGLHEMNNTLGHKSGDEMLIYIANALRGIFGRHTYRVGGDEFVALINGIDEMELKTMAKAACDAAEDKGYHIALGYEFADNAIDMHDMIKKAEAKMYSAKAEYYSQNGNDRRIRK